jgi:hypothetical protein
MTDRKLLRQAASQTREWSLAFHAANVGRTLGVVVLEEPSTIAAGHRAKSAMGNAGSVRQAAPEPRIVLSNTPYTLSR